MASVLLLLLTLLELYNLKWQKREQMVDLELESRSRVQKRNPRKVKHNIKRL